MKNSKKSSFGCIANPTAISAAIQNQIKAMVLVGDPLFNPALTSVNKGTFDASLYGIWVVPGWPYALPVRQFATNMISKVASYCLANDFVCNSSPASLTACVNSPTTCPHGLYKPSWTQQAAAWARSKVTF